MMKRFDTLVLILSVATLGGLYGWVRLRPEMGEVAAPRLVLVEGPAKHVVTPKMSSDSQQMIERTATPFQRIDASARTQSLADLCRKGPVVLTFVKDGCPCSEAAQPFFNRMAAAYPSASFLAVIDVAPEAAKRWAGGHGVQYPILSDPACQLMHDYAAENSAYVVLIDGRGRIARHWPGYSAGMLTELGESLATLAGVKIEPIDLADAPDSLYSGCPF